MKVRYVGESFGFDELTNGKVYKCLGFENGWLRVIDDSEEDYTYSAYNPAPLDGSSCGGVWELVEDDEKGTSKKALQYDLEMKQRVDEEIATIRQACRNYQEEQRKKNQ